MLNKRFYLAFFSILLVLLVSIFSMRQESQAQDKYASKVYECLEVGTDVACLKKHIEKQYDVIDQFIILESLVGIQGESKELLYEKHKDEFTMYSDKITYVVTSTLPESNQKLIKEFYLKNQYLKALEDCQDQDIILFSTADLAVNTDDLHHGISWLEKHPEEIIKLKAQNLKNRSKNQNVRAATFAQVKEMLPAGIEKQTQLKTRRVRRRSIFSLV